MCSGNNLRKDYYRGNVLQKTKKSKNSVRVTKRDSSYRESTSIYHQKVLKLTAREASGQIKFSAENTTDAFNSLYFFNTYFGG